MTIPNDRLPAVPRLKYEEVRGHIQSGDILLCSGQSMFSRLIKRFTGSIWSHIAFILRIDQIERIMIMESVESKGVQTVPLSHYVNNYEGTGKPYAGDILLARHGDFKVANIGHISRHAVDRLGHQYDSREIARIASRISIGKLVDNDKCEMPVGDNQYICSEYVYECYQSVGIHIQHNCGGFISPADFAMTEQIEPICLIKLD